jgi:parvulin-like peptidyl-prolyl isomerase
MTDLVRINDDLLTALGLVKHLKLSGQFDSLIEEIVREKLTVQVAKKTGVEVSAEEIQDRANQIRRVRGLHRAVDMNRWLDQLQIDLDDLENFIVDGLYFEKMQAEIVTDEKIEEYFSLNSPKFDCIVVSHIIVDAEGKAREILALLEDAPEMLNDLAREHSLADTASEGGYIGPVMRGALSADIEAKVFHAEQGDVLGPFVTADSKGFEIFCIDAKLNAKLDEDTVSQIGRIIKEEWYATRAKENRIEMC